MENPEEHGKAIRDAIVDELREQGKNQDDLARVLGRDRSTVTKTLNGKPKLTFHFINAAARLLGLNYDKLLLGIREKEAVDGDDSSSTDRSVVVSSAIRPSSDAHTIPEVDVTGGAGEGTIGEIVSFPIGDETYTGHAIVGEWQIPDGFTDRALGIRAHNSLIMRVTGDSMDPTYRNGDRVVIDLRQARLTNDGVYLISDGESPPQIKRLQRVMFSKPPEVIVVSDNPSHVNQTVRLDCITIIGRVAGRFTAT